MSVRQIAESKFIIDYYPDGRKGKRVRKVYTLPSREIAETIERDLVSLNKKSNPLQSSDLATIDSLFPAYLKWFAKHRAASTLLDVENTYTKHISRIMGSVKVHDLKTTHISLYKNIRGAEKAIRGHNRKGAPVQKTTYVSNRTIMKELSYFSGFLRWCRREMELDIKPIHIEQLPHARPKPIVLSPEEVGAILKSLDTTPRAVVLLLYTMGLRLSEAIGLKWENVDFANSVLRVIQKGGEWKVLPMNTWVVNSLKKLPRTGAHVFHNPKTGKPIYNIRKPLEKARRAAGIEKKVNHHLFRHSIATHLMGRNVQTRLIQEYLGHAEIDSTDWYMHINMKLLGDATKGAFDFMENIPELNEQVTTP